MKEPFTLSKKAIAIIVIACIVVVGAIFFVVMQQGDSSKPDDNSPTSSQEKQEEGKKEDASNKKEDEGKKQEANADKEESVLENNQEAETPQDNAQTSDSQGDTQTDESQGNTQTDEPQASVQPSQPQTNTQVDQPQNNPAHTHAWGQVASKNATCTQAGYIDEKCQCGETRRQEIPATGVHSFGEWTTKVAATEQNVGLNERVCSGCGAVETEEIPMLAPSVPWNEEVLRLVNIERANNGLPALGYAYNAQSAADIRATEITQVFDHTRPNGTSCFTALDETGVSYFTAGENIAYGYPTPAAVVDGWMNSPGHRANILNTGFTHLAVGVNGTAWVQLFIG